MCFDHDSSPPVPGGDPSVSSADITLTAADRNQLMAFITANT